MDALGEPTDTPLAASPNHPELLHFCGFCGFCTWFESGVLYRLAAKMLFKIGGRSTMAIMDFFFFYGSTYTYLTVMRIEELTSAAGVNVRWRPFNVRQLMTEMENVPFANKPVKTAYMWRDIERRASKHGISFTEPPTYPVDPDLIANRVGVVAAEEGWCPEYTKASYQAWFLENKPLGDGENVEAILRSLGKDPKEIIERANSAEIVSKYEEETDAARNLGIFGSPTFVVKDEIFWGDDRLEDALEWRARAAPAKT